MPDEKEVEMPTADIGSQEELNKALKGPEVPTDDLFEDPDAIPQSDWMKFETPGDMVQGRLFEEPQYDQPGKFGPQNVYTLELADGSIKMVGLNPTSHVRATRQLKQAEVGDIVAIKFVDEYDSGKGNPGKNMEVRIRHQHK